MIYLNIFRVRFWRAILRDLRNTHAQRRADHTCRITHDPVPPEHRATHEATQHPTDGPCVLL